MLSIISTRSFGVSIRPAALCTYNTTGSPDANPVRHLVCLSNFTVASVAIGCSFLIAILPSTYDHRSNHQSSNADG